MKNVIDYIENNRRAYESYLRVPLGHGAHMILSMIILIGISKLIILTRNQALKRYFLREAGKQDLGLQEVIDWVNGQVELQKRDVVYWILIVITIFIIIWIGFIYIRMKSYDLYKRQRILVLCPVVIYILLGILVVYNSGERGGSIYLGIKIFLEILPILSGFKLFLPLNMREEYNKWLAIFEIVSNFVLKKL